MSTSSSDFYHSALDGLPQQITVIDRAGNLRWVNAAWRSFSVDNEGNEQSTCIAANYLDACERAMLSGDKSAADIFQGLKQLVIGQSEEFFYEYPCHSPTELRWFLMRARGLSGAGQGHWIISHENITERRFAAERLKNLSITDALTALANRRHFDIFLDAEIRRSTRSSQMLSLILLDIDHFKFYNDYYGHVGGDACLQKVARAIKSATNRPSDLAARYGGEEFAIVLAQTSMEGAIHVSEALLQSLRNQRIPNKGAGAGKYVTASIGLVAIKPDQNLRPEDLIARADKALYRSKRNGRDQFTVYQP